VCVSVCVVVVVVGGCWLHSLLVVERQAKLTKRVVHTLRWNGVWECVCGAHIEGSVCTARCTTLYVHTSPQGRISAY